MDPRIEGAKFAIGEEVRSEWHGEQGTVAKIEWSFTFGSRTYLLTRTLPGRIAGAVGSIGNDIGDIFG